MDKSRPAPRSEDNGDTGAETLAFVGPTELASCRRLQGQPLLRTRQSSQLLHGLLLLPVPQVREMTVVDFVGTQLVSGHIRLNCGRRRFVDLIGI